MQKIHSFSPSSIKQSTAATISIMARAKPREIAASWCQRERERIVGRVYVYIYTADLIEETIVRCEFTGASISGSLHFCA